MKKRIIAMLLVLAMALSLTPPVAFAATDAESAEGSYKVGYSKVDINPYADGTGDNQTLSSIPMGGYAKVLERLSNGKKLDDNGDGVVDENDGIFVTCTAVTDKLGNTALFFNCDLLWAFEVFQTATLDVLLKDEAFAQYNLSRELIFFNGSHNHFAPATGYGSAKYEFADAYNAWETRVKNQLVAGAKAALEDRAWADMYKGSVDISEYFNEDDRKETEVVGDLLNDLREDATKHVTESTYADLTGDVEEIFFNCVRHYKITEQRAKTNADGSLVVENDKYVADPTAPVIVSYSDQWYGVGYRRFIYEYDEATGAEGDLVETRIVTAWEPATKTNDDLHLVEFRFSDNSGKDSVVMLNWRGHLPSTAVVSQDNTTSEYQGSSISEYTSYYQVSAGMVNSLRYALQLEGYRVAFLQGTGGNINMAENGIPQEGWVNHYVTEKHNIYGTELAQIALHVLKNDMELINANGGEIRGTQQILETYYPEVTAFQYMAGLRYKYEYNSTINPDGLTGISGKRVYGNLYYYEDANGNVLIDATNGLPMTDESGVAATDPATGKAYTDAEGNAVVGVTKHAYDGVMVIPSIYQGNRYAEGYARSGKKYQELSINAMVIGDDFSLVAAGTELFDHYVGENDENLWETLAEKYGTPFILGYGNSPAGGYLPDKNTYHYNENGDEPTYVVGTYESTTTPYAEGTGEALVEQLDVMLDFLKEGYASEDSGNGICVHCGKVVTWTDLSKEVNEGYLQFNRYMTSGHYYLPEGSEVTLANKTVDENQSVCIDLNGQTLQVEQSVEIDAGATLSIMDSVGTGKVVGYEAPRLGGVFYAQANATLNLYGGTLSYAGTPNPEQSSGGIVYVSGTFNMYDGLIEGTSVNHCGGAVHVETAGTANLRGGIIRGGTAKYGTTMTSNGTVLLAGDVEIENLYYLGQAHGLHFEGKFTGKVPYIGGILKGVDVGDADEDVDIYGAEWKMFGLWDYMPQLVKKETGGYDVYIQPMTNFVAKDKETKEYFYGYYTDQADIEDELLLADVLPKLSEGSEIKMMWTGNMPNTLTLNVDKDLHLDLNGKTVNSTITVAEDMTLYVSDSATADYDLAADINNRTRGHLIKSKISGNVVGAPATENSDVYMAVEESGNVYFHAVKLNIDQLVLRADHHGEDGSAQPGVYFKHQFAGDTTVTGLVDSYGIAFSLVDDPSAQDLSADATKLKDYVYKSGDVVYTQYGVEEFPYGETTATNTSTLITGIMKDTNTLSVNKANASMPIHGTAYIKLTTGEYILGVTRERSLKEQVEGIDTVWEMLSQTQRNGVLKMQKNSAFASIVKAWDLTNMTDGAKSQAPEEEKVLRVLSIGNSHTDNATQYLYDVFQAENPDQEVQIAQLYHSGCSIKMHVDFAASNAVEYVYRTNEDRHLNNVKNSTLKQALQAEVWDVIILHDMNNPTATGDSFTGTNKRNLQKHINYVKNNSLNSDPTLIWNFSWANPTDADLMATTSAGWAERYQNEWGTKYDTMLACMIANTKQYVMTNAAFADVAPTGLAFQHVRNSFVAAGNTASEADNLLYCDYTHATDSYGCILASYVWYATITGQTQIDEIKVTKNMTAEELAQLDLMLDGVNYALANKASLLP